MVQQTKHQSKITSRLERLPREIRKVIADQNVLLPSNVVHLASTSKQLKGELKNAVELARGEHNLRYADKYNDGALVATLANGMGFTFISLAKEVDQAANLDNNYDMFISGNSDEPFLDAEHERFVRESKQTFLDPIERFFYRARFVWVCKDRESWSQEGERNDLTDDDWSHWRDGVVCMKTDWPTTEIIRKRHEVNTEFIPWVLEDGTKEEWFKHMSLARLIEVRRILVSMLEITPSTERQKEHFRMYLQVFEKDDEEEEVLYDLMYDEHGPSFCKILNSVMVAHEELRDLLIDYDALIAHMKPYKGAAKVGGKGEGQGKCKIAKETELRSELLYRASNLGIKGISRMNKINLVLAINKLRRKLT